MPGSYRGKVLENILRILVQDCKISDKKEASRTGKGLIL